MLETLKTLKINDMLTLDDETILNVTNREDFSVTYKKVLQCDEGECVILELDDYFLISYNLGGDEVHFLVELENGITPFSDVPEEITISVSGDEFNYQMSSVEWRCGDDVICEYYNDDEEFDKVILEQTPKNNHIYRGFAISEDSIII